MPSVLAAMELFALRSLNRQGIKTGIYPDDLAKVLVHFADFPSGKVRKTPTHDVR